MQMFPYGKQSLYFYCAMLGHGRAVRIASCYHRSHNSFFLSYLLYSLLFGSRSTVGSRLPVSDRERNRKHSTYRFVQRGAELYCEGKGRSPYIFTVKIQNSAIVRLFIRCSFSPGGHRGNKRYQWSRCLKQYLKQKEQFLVGKEARRT